MRLYEMDCCMRTLLIIGLLLGFGGRTACGKECSTFQCKFTAELSIFVATAEPRKFAVETGSFAFDAVNERAIYRYTIETEEKWENVEYCVDGTQALITWEVGRDDEKLANGMNGATETSLRKFLADRPLAPLFGYYSDGKDGAEALYPVLEFVHSDAALKGNSRPFRNTMANMGYSEGKLSSLYWERSRSEARTNLNDTLAYAAFFSEFRIVGGFEVPHNITTKFKRAGGELAIGPGLRAEPVNKEVPDKTFISTIRLFDVQVNDELPSVIFDDGVEDGHPATYRGSEHIAHVLVKNRLVPLVDARAQGLLDRATFSAPRFYIAGLSIVLSIAIFLVLAFKGRGRSTSSLAILACLCGVANGNESVVRYPEGPYCGVYPAVAAMAAMGHNVPATELLNKDFVSTPEGSSASDIVAMLKRSGFNASTMSNLSHNNLEIASDPIILHCRATGGIKAFNHWICFLGFKEGKPYIYDPPNRLTTCNWVE